MPLPVQGRHTTVTLSLDATGGQTALGGQLLTPMTPQSWVIQNFQVTPEQDVITSRYLGTNEPDEDMQPMGFSGSMSCTHKTADLLNAFDQYQEAKEFGVPINFMITVETRYRLAGAISRVTQYLRVELNMSESYEPGRHSTIEIAWRAPKRITQAL